MKQAFTFVIDGETRQKRQGILYIGVILKDYISEVLMTTIEKNIGNKIELKDSVKISPVTA